MKRTEAFTFRWIVPLVLLLYPLVKAAVGVDYMDSMYSPGNFVFFPQMEGTWVVATFLANGIGFLLTKLPGAGCYLGLRIYTNLFISLLALTSYFWLKKKIPAWIAALGELIAIGFCWCPTTILYNYLTYLFMLLSLIFLYEGLVQGKKYFLVIAGVLLGLNLFVRFPNVIETGFILAVWAYGFWKKKKFSQVAADTLWCILGYLISSLSVLLVIFLLYGFGAYGEMIGSLFSMTDSAASYKPIEMLLAIVREYTKGLKWPLGMALYGLMMSAAFVVFRGRFIRIKKAVTVLGILVLFRWYYAKGMFNINYHTYPSMFQWVVCFLILTIVTLLPTIFHRKVEAEKKLLYFLVLLTIGITPIGSNNNLFPIMNNLFFVAPVSLYALYHIVKKAERCTYAFPVQAVLTAAVLALFIQSIGFGVTFSFRGAREGEKRDTKIEKNGILKGMVTNLEKAEAIEGLTLYWEEQFGEVTSSSGADSGQELLLFGHIPGVSYFLNTPTAISTSWPDLASYAYQTFEQEMDALREDIISGKREKPVLIVSYGVAAVTENDANAMEWYAEYMESGEETLEVMKASPKLLYLKEFMEQCGYVRTYGNQRFVVYE